MRSSCCSSHEGITGDHSKPVNVKTKTGSIGCKCPQLLQFFGCLVDLYLFRRSLALALRSALALIGTSLGRLCSQLFLLLFGVMLAMMLALALCNAVFLNKTTSCAALQCSSSVRQCGMIGRLLDLFNTTLMPTTPGIDRKMVLPYIVGNTMEGDDKRDDWNVDGRDAGPLDWSFCICRPGKLSGFYPFLCLLLAFVGGL